MCWPTDCRLADTVYAPRKCFETYLKVFLNKYFFIEKLDIFLICFLTYLEIQNLYMYFQKCFQMIFLNSQQNIINILKIIKQIFLIYFFKMNLKIVFQDLCRMKFIFKLFLIDR